MPTRPAWVCPVCGRSFTQRTREHSCDVYTLDYHLRGKPPAVAALLHAYLDVVRLLGPLSIDPLKTMIVIKARVNLGGVKVRRSGLLCNLALRAAPVSPRVTGGHPYGPHKFAFDFELHEPGEIDAELRDWLQEAYELASGS